jgi:hypothetical protein
MISEIKDNALAKLYFIFAKAESLSLSKISPSLVSYQQKKNGNILATLDGAWK